MKIEIVTREEYDPPLRSLYVELNDGWHMLIPINEKTDPVTLFPAIVQTIERHQAKMQEEEVSK